MARLQRLIRKAFDRFANPGGVGMQCVPSFGNSEPYEQLLEGVSGCLAGFSEFLPGFKLEDASVCAKIFSSSSVVFRWKLERK